MTRKKMISEAMRILGRRRWKGVSKKRRSAITRQAIKARWQKAGKP